MCQVGSYMRPFTLPSLNPLVRRQVKTMAPAAKKLASCNKNTATLAARLAAKTASLDKCNANTAALSKRVR